MEAEYRDESKGAKSQEMLATGALAFLFSAQKASELSARDGEMGGESKGRTFLGRHGSPRERPGKTELGLWRH